MITTNKKRVAIIVGTRPEAIKMAPVFLELNKNQSIETKLISTGQHIEMLDQSLTLFGITPTVNFKVMQSGQNLNDVTCRILQESQIYFSKWRPDLVLVHGDTTTTLAAALSCYYQKIPVLHVEAGLRTNDIYSPWPEEGNRKLVSVIAEAHATPTSETKKNLLDEGVDTSRVYVTGNSVIDSILFAKAKLMEEGTTPLPLLEYEEYIKQKNPLILITAHRRENFGAGLENICTAIKLISSRCNVNFILPVHPNPNVSHLVNARLSGIKNIKLIPPQEYLSFTYLMMQSKFILSDSGGVQEEAPALGKKVLLLRDTTERPEAVAAGTVKLIGTNTDEIILHTEKLINSHDFDPADIANKNPYGKGDTSKQIHQIVCQMLNL